MWEAKQIQQWDHTAALMSLIANMVRGKHDRPITLEQCHPYRHDMASNRKPFEHLRELLTNGNGRSN